MPALAFGSTQPS